MAHTIILTGGGSAGHTTPNLALLPYLRQEHYEIHYIGSLDGIEKDIISNVPDITYHGIPCGKLRRYFSWKNFSDPFRILSGYQEAKKLMKKLQPEVVFSKGGFVSVPVVAAAHARKVPVVSHESDISMGLANKLSKRYATHICLTFPDVLKEIQPPVGIYTGSPIRSELYEGNAEKGRAFLGFDQKPVLLMMGGSLGAQAINVALRAALPELLREMNVVHLCGKGNLDDTLSHTKGYAQFEYINKELADIMALSDYILSRAGSNSIHEFLALKKPMLLIPLPLSASRGDQILNAKSFTERNFAITLEQEQLDADSLIAAIHTLCKQASAMTAAMQAEPNADGTKAIFDVIMQTARSKTK